MFFTRTIVFSYGPKLRDAKLRLRRKSKKIGDFVLKFIYTDVSKDSLLNSCCCNFLFNPILSDLNTNLRSRALKMNCGDNKCAENDIYTEGSIFKNCVFMKILKIKLNVFCVKIMTKINVNTAEVISVILELNNGSK